MNFIENLKDIMGVDDLFDTCHVKFIIVLEKGGYFENVLGILSYSETEIVLSVKKGKISIKGENLYVKKYCEGDLSICGKITSIEKE